MKEVGKKRIANISGNSLFTITYCIRFVSVQSYLIKAVSHLKQKDRIL